MNTSSEENRVAGNMWGLELLNYVSSIRFPNLVWLP